MKKNQTSAEEKKQSASVATEAVQDEVKQQHQNVTDKQAATDNTNADAGQESEASAEKSSEDQAVGEAADTPAVEEEVSSLRNEIEHLRDTLMRRTAEFENIKKRMLRERIQLLEDAKIEALKSFLPINDDLQRTLAASDGQEIPEGFLKGVSMVADKFSNVLESSGVEAINETGVPFDVNLHDALMRQPAPDGNTPSDTVLQVLEPGYKSGDKVIRHAKVIVSE